ncbi:MAG: glycosyltransferase family 4 protein [Candidatus Bathyarchaeia archaeon]
MSSSLSIAVVSPFLDKRHGTERRVAEGIERLAHEYGYEIHIYSQRVEDIEGVQMANGEWRAANGGSQKANQNAGGGRIVWHKVPDIPGPHLTRYVFWFFANQVMRWWDRKVRGIHYDLVYSPGINCLDADVISVHIVFAEFYRQVRDDLNLWHNPIKSWARLLHRRLYYRLIMALEQRIYARKDLPLATVSRKVIANLIRFYRHDGPFFVVYPGIDSRQFNPKVRSDLRLKAREELKLPDEAFALLLIGNGWKNKGLRCLLEAVGRLAVPNIWVLVVGQDDPIPFYPLIQRYGLSERVRFLPPRRDVEFYYAVADVYVGPSLEDAFALPPAEAMACGLPVIVSSHAGVSEIITDGVDGLILNDPRDPDELARLIQRLYMDEEFRKRLGEVAAQTARQYTWERNAQQMHEIFTQVVKRKGLSAKG